MQSPDVCEIWKTNVSKKFIKIAKFLSWFTIRISVLISVAYAAPSDKKDVINTYDVEYGVYLGQLSTTANSQVSGKVFLVNESTLQVIDFSYTGKTNGQLFAKIIIRDHLGQKK
jgi:hypothetical protein